MTDPTFIDWLACWMDGRKDGWMDKWMVGWINGWLDKWMVGWIHFGFTIDAGKYKWFKEMKYYPAKTYFIPIS